ncbi:glyoxylase-like metal-dependent hydrolase (beta-lactamase superfamily II) [Rhodovulum euryhalinum]|uniref:Glyoxylase-like metal-dependent hydrolase (Beta-lactamase superfamily II) n=2 Tax=Rhodovulum euryhalinum TaxID=35805 RepID=A0A4R2KDW3_9RHOB|nr:glyoxylase-like metal-dependent hydrolase (beta-lactamase superfamily II) [Rhodovulum euryhalinum]
MMDGARPPIRYPFAEPPGPGGAVEIAEGVLWLRQPLPMPLDHVNVYALDDGDGWTVVDTGIASRKSRELWQELLTGPLCGRPVTRVIVTHHHPDHVGLAGWFQSDHGAELWTSRVAWLFARMLQLDEQARPVPETLAHWRGAGMDATLFDERAAQRPFNFADTVAPMPLGFRDMAEGGVIRAGGRDWDVRLGDGHAPDHVTLWSRDDTLVIGGDQLLPSISPNLGVYATEPLNDPVAGWMESCRRLAVHAREDHLVLPGHKLPFTGLPTRLAQLIENHEGALARLIDHLAEPRTACDCFVPLFRREIGPGEYVLALGEAVGHLNHLYLTGQARRWRRADGAWLFQSATAG